MKTIGYIFALFICVLGYNSFAQQSGSKPHAESVSISPNADRDITTGIDYINAIGSGDWAKVKTLLAPGFMQYGPGSVDSANAEQYAQIWQERYKITENREVTIIAATSVRVKEGYTAGDWVLVWFDYKATFKNEGKTVHIPVQVTMQMQNGKVAVDRVYFDGGSVWRQLGWTITPPQTAKK